MRPARVSPLTGLHGFESRAVKGARLLECYQLLLAHDALLLAQVVLDLLQRLRTTQRMTSCFLASRQLAAASWGTEEADADALHVRRATFCLQLRLPVHDRHQKALQRQEARCHEHQ